MKILHRVLLGILAALSVLIVGFIIRLNQTPKNLPPLIPISTPTPHPKITCKRFTDIAVALKNIEIACVLDLSNQNLTTLPSSIRELKKLNELDVQNNNLITLPSEIYTLPLVKIDIRNNNIVTLLPEILTVPSLQEIDLSGNTISESEIQKIKDMYLKINIY